MIRIKVGGEMLTCTGVDIDLEAKEIKYDVPNHTIVEKIRVSKMGGVESLWFLDEKQIIPEVSEVTGSDF